MKLLVQSGKTNYTVQIFIQDSTSLTGAGLTGLAAADLTCYRSWVETDNDVVSAQISLSDLTALTDAHSDGGIFEVDATNLPGLYRLDLPDNIFGASIWSSVVMVKDAATNNVVPVLLEFQMVESEPLTSSADIADAIWDEAISAHTASDTFGGSRRIF